MHAPSPEQYLDSIRADTSRISRLLDSMPESAWDARVETCGDWTVRDLVVHLGGVHRMATQATTEGTKSWSHHHLPTDGTDLRLWFDAGAAHLLAELDTDPVREAWSFIPGAASAGFWQRRQAMENLVHRIDAEIALNARSPIGADIAADGIAEVLDTLIPFRAANGGLEVPEPGVSLFARDVERRYSLGGAGESSVADMVGPAADLLLVLWKRTPSEALDEVSPRAASFLRSQLTF